MGMILRIASSRIVGQGDIVGRSGYFSLNLSANSVMRGRLDARRTLKSLVADLRKTMSVAEFKAQHNVEKIEVKRNEHTGKCFFVYGFETGACSRKVESGELTIPVISEVCSAETGDIFLLLHQKGEGGATTLATL